MVVGSVVVLTLTALSVLHVYWANGGIWPGNDRSDLARKVAGQDEFPSTGSTYAVAVALIVAAVLVGASAGLWSLGIPSWIVNLGTWVVFGVFAIRGVGGIIYSSLKLSRGSDHPFLRPNLIYYSPLTTLLAVGVLIVSI